VGGLEHHICVERDNPVSDDEGPKKDSQPDGPAGRQRRRNRPRRVFDTSVPSPCIAVCQLDPRTERCIGCLRHVDEIRDWPILSAAQKRAILAALPERR